MVFALFALLLAAIGIYGVIAFGVSQRTREIGIRLALGATKEGILRLVIRQGMKMVLIGCLLGLAASLALTKLMQSMLFQVSPTDPLTFLLGSTAVMFVALLGCWLPGRKASLLDPSTALRQN